jgi:hypothetical protein
VRWDELTVADALLSGPEHDSAAPLQYQPVEEIFTTRAAIWHVHGNGRVIRTTAEHPFWVWNKGWVSAFALQAGDRLRCHDGRTATVEEAIDAGYEEQVYNCRVAQYHTYFVTGAGWDFAVWAHNLCGGHFIGPRTNGAARCCHRMGDHESRRAHGGRSRRPGSWRDRPRSVRRDRCVPDKRRKMAHARV